MPKKKESTADIEERRRKGRIKAQKFRDRIKADPDAYAKTKEAEHVRYLKRKEKGTIKMIGELSKRGQRVQQKKWNHNSANYRRKIEAAKEFERHLEANTPPTSPDILEPLPASLPSSINSGGSSRAKCGRKKVARDRAKAYCELKKKDLLLKQSLKNVAKYKKRYYRLLAANATSSAVANSPSPRTKVCRLLKGKTVPLEVKRKLVFGEAIVSQLKSSRVSLTTVKEKRVFNNIIGSKFLKKYKMLYEARSLFKQQRKLRVGTRCNAVNDDVREKVIKFLEEDENSRQSPGKKDCLTRGGIKKQIRKLSFSLEELYEKFILENPMKISYATFCRLRPFYIIHPKVSDRETCTCMIHDNADFLVDKLYRLKLINQKNAEELIPVLCCTNTQSEDCFMRKCDNCINKKIIENVNQDISEKEIEYYQWELCKEERTIKEKTCTVQFTAKKSKNGTVNDLISTLEKSMPKFLHHVCNMRHQFKSISNLKLHLKETEALIHVDFSENYVCKYGKETQSVHFGAGHRQITLHTGMYYFRTSSVSDTEYQAFCTISANNRHDAAAIWAHLTPILREIKLRSPNVDTYHFYSDSPSTQYRNKSNFLLFTRYLPSLLDVKESTWNYSESGHGKGAPDGIGGVMKRTADTLVARGNDITNAERFKDMLTDKCKNVQLIMITDEDINKISDLLPSSINAIKGTMQLHQVTWQQVAPDVLTLRTLSCFHCNKADLSCKYAFTPNKTTRIGLLQVDEDSEEQDVDNTLESAAPQNTNHTSPPNIGDWVAVIFDDVWYPGVVNNSIKDESMLEVQFMVRTRKYFKWPEKDDIHFIKYEGILSRIDGQPIPVSTTSRCSGLFTFLNIEHIDRVAENLIRVA